MANKGTNGLSKGTYLELRVARLLMAEGFSPFVNVYFRNNLEPHSVINPDIDVMGCHALSDGTIVYAHYDCKSGSSDVVSRILMLTGLRNRIPPGPIVYVRPNANLDIRKYAAQYGIRLTDIGQLEERERGCVYPRFGEEFPSISDRSVHEIWLSIKGRTKDKQLGRIFKYLDFIFWSEEPFTRIRRTLAAVEQLPIAYAEAGVQNADQDVLTSIVLRKLVYALLVGASHIGFLSDMHVNQLVSERLVSESLPQDELHNIVESTAQFIYQLYGDASKGSLRAEDYSISPPDYAEELASLLMRTVQLYGALTSLLPVFDALIVEQALLGRPSMAQALLSNTQLTHIDSAKRWYRSLRLFLSTLCPAQKEWIGWRSLLSTTDPNTVSLQNTLGIHYASSNDDIQPQFVLQETNPEEDTAQKPDKSNRNK